jgi:DNA-binding HxlR family transcriptional regulator
MLIKSKVKRSYRQMCGIAKALDVVGERWTLLLARNLLVGPLRYKDLLETLPGITTNLLAERLKDMTEAGLIAQRTLPPPGAAVVYELTPRGRELEPVLLALGRFGASYLGAPKRGDRTHVRWAMVSLKRRYQGSTRAASIALAVDAQHQYRLHMQGARLEIEEGAPSERDDVRVRMPGDAFRALLFQGAHARALVAAGRIAIDGNAQAFFDLVSAVGAAA